MDPQEQQATPAAEDQPRTTTRTRATRHAEDQRTRVKLSNQRLNRTIRAHSGSCYAEVARLNIFGVTGLLPRELREARGVRKTRDGLSSVELAALHFEEELESSAIQRRGVLGDRDILMLVSDITMDMTGLRLKYGGGSLNRERSPDAEAPPQSAPH